METKTIFFVLDSFNFYDFKKLYGNHEYITCYSYIDTEQAIENKITNILTYDIGHLSFDLETLGYKIFIGYNGKYKHFTVGMSTANGKELRFAHNLRRLLIGGALDNDLGIIRDRNYYMGYDTTESADISSMLNADQVSSYAVYPMEWAVGSGLISGSETKDELGNIVYDLNPKGNTTRAQMATILQRFCEYYHI